MKIQIINQWRLRGKYLGACHYCHHSAPTWVLSAYVQGAEEHYSAFGRQLKRTINMHVNYVCCEACKQKILAQSTK